MKAEVAELGTGLRSGRQSLEAEMEAGRADTARWVVGLLGGPIALARLLPK